MIKQKRIKAFSLAELLLGMALFAFLVTSVASFSVDAVRAVRNSSTKVIAAQRIQELSNALLLNKDALWSSIVANTEAGDKSLVYSNNTYYFQDGAVSDVGILIKLAIGNVQRDSSGNIVISGGTQDLHTRAITFTATWTDFLGIVNSAVSTIYVSDWNTLNLQQTTQTEFNLGTNNTTITTNNAGGEVTMESIVYADWCKPYLTQYSYDLPGQGIAKSISAEPGSVYMGTGSNSSGVSFARMSFVPSEPPTVGIVGIFDGYKTNAIFGQGDYAYLATQTNSKEVVILNIASTPYTEIGYFNPPVNSAGKGVFVNGTVGIMATATKLYTFDVSSKTGSRPVIGSINLNGTATDLFVRGNFAYLTLSNATSEVEIIDLTNPASLQSVGWYDINSAAAVTIYVNEAGTRAYVATTVVANQPEFFIVDVANKVGNHTSIGGYDTNGMLATDIVVPANSNRAVIVGKGGVEQYQVVTLDNESNPQYCGGLAITNGVNAIAAVTESNGNVYSHVVTTNASAELRTIRGGEGGGGESGIGYPATADYTSKVFDTQSITSQYFTLEWNATFAGGSGIKLQLRSSDIPAMTGSTWVGPDGTNATYFTAEAATSIPSVVSNKQYVQYKVFFESDDGAHASIFNQVELTYQK